MEDERELNVIKAQKQLAAQYKDAALQLHSTLTDFEKNRKKFSLNFWIVVLQVVPILFPMFFYRLSGDSWTAADWLLNSMIFSTGVFLEAFAIFLLVHDRDYSKRCRIFERYSETLESVWENYTTFSYSGEWCHSELVVSSSLDDTADRGVLMWFADQFQSLLSEYRLEFIRYRNALYSRPSAWLYGAVYLATCLVQVIFAYVVTGTHWDIPIWIFNLVMLSALAVDTLLCVLLMRWYYQCKNEQKLHIRHIELFAGTYEQFLSMAAEKRKVPSD